MRRRVCLGIIITMASLLATALSVCGGDDGLEDSGSEVGAKDDAGSAPDCGRGDGVRAGGPPDATRASPAVLVHARPSPSDTGTIYVAYPVLAFADWNL